MTRLFILFRAGNEGNTYPEIENLNLQIWKSLINFDLESSITKIRLIAKPSHQ